MKKALDHWSTMDRQDLNGAERNGRRHGAPGCQVVCACPPSDTPCLWWVRWSGLGRVLAYRRTAKMLFLVCLWWAKWSGFCRVPSWGRMAAGHDYFEWGILDRFSGAAMQKLLIKSDGTGNKPGWYLRHGSVSSMQHKWAVDQWLALDEAPNQLFATRNGCGLCQGTAVIFVN
ncbi:hypothetical protein HU200_026975 [Digitaria exilis]|uniref:Uncharacterized protein n=1 Tax=Digitaria exilis TaxID=1010633 RepID=A0A835EUW2_9POAL|nr:hypothetical protein HU200_026975 [Digitaria exilis]